MDKGANQEIIKQALIVLDYHIKWLEFSFIDETLLLAQYYHLLNSEDKCREHYRYASFQKILIDNQYLDDEAIDKYIQLAELDNDKVMASAALMNLFQWEKLKEEQYIKLVNHPVFSHHSFQKYHQKQMVLKATDESVFSDQDVEFYIHNYEPSIQKYLLTNKKLTVRQLEYISQNGGSKKVRNIANNLLRNQDFR
ncbi:hypothetical protein [Calothrix sp. 336/3]|uniref:hypothetical protein n=1 Tax=Calothrix sp. 336/3 TaxID=1337936 RepID=UPI0004E35909|nr:hypothetical protein [Calothrix sp. 336/3]AKG22012.1 hypothetical protein IJ00_12750 [Calothrix sp. 336/3]